MLKIKWIPHCSSISWSRGVELQWKLMQLFRANVAGGTATIVVTGAVTGATTGATAVTAGAGAAEATEAGEAVCAGFIELMAALFIAVVADIVEGTSAKNCIRDKEANGLKAGKVNTGRGVRLSWEGGKRAFGKTAKRDWRCRDRATIYGDWYSNRRGNRSWCSSRELENEELEEEEEEADDDECAWSLFYFLFLLFFLDR